MCPCCVLPVTPISPGPSLSSGPPSTPPVHSSTSSLFNSNSNSPSTPQTPTPPNVALSLLPQLEQAATLAYTSPNNDERKRNADLLVGFHNNIECIPQCRMVLDNSRNEFALLLAASGLLKLVTMYHATMGVEDTVAMKNYLLNYLATQCQQLPRFVLTPLIQCLVRVVKLGWRVDQRFSEVLSDVGKFLAATPRHHRVGLVIMSELVQEMNENRTGESQVEHRRTARSFRDATLLQVFTMSMASIRQVAQQPGISNDGELDELLGSALGLANACLTFDFIGSMLDESLDELAQMSLQLPAQWRVVMEDSNTPSLFYDILSRIQPARQAQALEVLGGLATARRSIFSSEDKRMSFLSVMARGVQTILSQQSTTLTNSDVFHHFCIALARLKTNYPLPELSKLPIYEDLISLIANFTLSAFKSSSSPNSLHYLLLVWSRVVADLPYLKVEVSPFLSSFLPSISTVFIQSRLDAIVSAVNDDAIDEMFEEPALSDQLKSLPALLKYNYSRSKEWLKAAIDRVMSEYSSSATASASGGGGNSQKQVRVAEGHLAMLIYMWAGIIAHDAPTPAQRLGWEKENPHGGDYKETSESYDAELCAWYFQSMPVVEYRLSSSQPSSPNASAAVLPQLAQASLYFLQQFRIRFMQQVTKTTSEQKESDMMGEGGHTEVGTLSFTSPPSPSQLGSIGQMTTVVYPLVPAYLPFNFSPLLPLLASNTFELEYGSYNTTSRGSSFFHKLNSAYKSLASSQQQQQQLTKTAITQTSITANMLSTALLFLNVFASNELVVASSLELLENLSLGYASSQLLSASEPIKNILQNHRFDAFPFLTRAGAQRARLHSSFYVILGRILFKQSNVEHFDAFMAAFNSAFDALNSLTNLRSDASAQATVALTRKLQGLLEACVSYSTYLLMFDFLYPQYMPVLLRLCETFADHPLVSSSILHLFSELVYNRAQRIRFDANSPNGIVLFRETSKLLTIYAHRLLAVKPDPGSEAYKVRIKGVSLCLTVLGRALSGGYVNFGVMALYDDASLVSVFKLMLQLIISLQLNDLLTYPQLTEPYFQFLEVSYKQHMQLLVDLDSKIFLALVSSLHEGLQSFNTACSTHAASAVDHLFSFVLSEGKRKRKAANYPRLLKHLAVQGNGLVVELLYTLLTMYLFDAVSNGYSISRPIFTLLCYSQEAWAEYRDRLVRVQLGQDAKERVARLMQDALQGVQLVHEHEQRDKFLSQLTVLKNELSQFAVRLS